MTARVPALVTLALVTVLASGTTTNAPTTVAGDDAAPGSGTAVDPTAAPTSAASAGTEPAAGDSSSAMATDTGDGGGVPCTTNSDCAGSEYCELADDSCGVSGVDGHCTPRPAMCKPEDRPVCGCDGQLHASTCEAARAGQDVDFLGECEIPGGAFACGYSFCILGEEYCSEQGGSMPTFECIVLPPVCQPPDCSCITDCCECENASCCSDYCSNDDDALTYTCPGA